MTDSGLYKFLDRIGKSLYVLACNGFPPACLDVEQVRHESMVVIAWQLFPSTANVNLAHWRRYHT